MVFLPSLASSSLGIMPRRSAAMPPNPEGYKPE